MANVSAQTKSVVCLSLELSEQEANALAGMMQNPLSSDESTLEKELREKIFMAIRPKPPPVDL